METICNSQKKYHPSLTSSSFYQPSQFRTVSTIRPTNDYTYPGTPRRSSIHTYGGTMGLGGSSWALWTDHSTGVPHKPPNRSRACSVILATAAFIVILAVLAVAGLAFYMGAIRSDSDEPILCFECNFRVLRGDLYTPGLRYNHTTVFRDKAQRYRALLDAVYKNSALGPALSGCQVDRFGNESLTVFYRLYLDRRKIPGTIANVEETLKEILLQDNASRKPTFRQIRIVPDSLTVTRQLGEQYKSASFYREETFTQTSQEPTLQTRSGVVRKPVTKTSGTTVTRKKPVKINDEPEIDTENLPVIEGSFELTKTDADITEKKDVQGVVVTEKPVKRLTTAKTERPTTATTTTTTTKKPTTSKPSTTVEITTKETEKPTTTQKIKETTTEFITPSTKEVDDLPIPNLDSLFTIADEDLDKQPWRPIKPKVETTSVAAQNYEPIEHRIGLDDMELPEVPMRQGVPSIDRSDYVYSSPFGEVVHDFHTSGVENRESFEVTGSPSYGDAFDPLVLSYHYGGVQKPEEISKGAGPPNILPQSINVMKGVLYTELPPDPVYTSFTNPEFSGSFLEIEKLGSSAPKPHQIPVNKILPPTEEVPDFKYISPNLKDYVSSTSSESYESEYSASEEDEATTTAKPTTLDYPPTTPRDNPTTVGLRIIKGELDGEGFEHLSGGVIIKKHQPLSSTESFFDGAEERHTDIDLHEMTKVHEVKQVPNDTNRKPVIKPNINIDKEPSHIPNDFVEVETLKYVPGSATSTEVPETPKPALPPSKWEYVNGTEMSFRNATFHKVYNDTLQAVVVHNTTPKIAEKIENKAVQNISSIFDTLSSKLGIVPNIQTIVPPFKGSRIESLSRATTTTSTTTENINLGVVEVVDPDMEDILLKEMVTGIPEISVTPLVTLIPVKSNSGISGTLRPRPKLSEETRSFEGTNQNSFFSSIINEFKNFAESSSNSDNKKLNKTEVETGTVKNTENAKIVTNIISSVREEISFGKKNITKDNVNLNEITSTAAIFTDNTRTPKTTKSENTPTTESAVHNVSVVPMLSDEINTTIEPTASKLRDEKDQNRQSHVTVHVSVVSSVSNTTRASNITNNSNSPLLNITRTSASPTFDQLTADRFKQLANIATITGSGNSTMFGEGGDDETVISTKAVSSSYITNHAGLKILTKTFNKIPSGFKDDEKVKIDKYYNDDLPTFTNFENNKTECSNKFSIRCGDGQCLPETARCNRLLDCQDGSDEKGCSCADYLRSQFLMRKICDGIVDCWDFSDENDCEWCTPGQYVCANSRTCVDNSKVCDGVKDCPHGDDERQCVTVAPDQIAASEFPYHTEGYLMVRKHGRWGKLCIQNFDRVIARSRTSWQVDDLGRAVCRAITYENYDKIQRITELSKDEKSEGDSYFELSYSAATNQSKSSLTFKPSPCTKKEVVKVICTELECGVRPQAVNQIARSVFVPSRRSRIVGGANSIPGAWPWQAALYKEGEFQCGATLINNQWLMSAGHCFYNAQEDFWVARLGALRRGTTFPSPYEQLRPISKILLHPGYVDIGFVNDISLLKMEQPVSFSDYVRPICLPSLGTTLRDGRMCTVVGWGQLFEFGRIFPDTLQEVELPVISALECRKRTLFLPLYKVTDNMFCAGYDRGGRDACLGDSGGPLMCQESDNRWSLYGVTSNGYGCARANRPGVYTKVSNYIEWVQKTIEESNQPENITKIWENYPTTKETLTEGRSSKLNNQCRGHRCPLGECLPKSRVCNGFLECSDGSDEQDCQRN